jgi:predicted ester cyclase
MNSTMNTQSSRNSQPGKGPSAAMSPVQMREIVRHWYEDVLSGTIAESPNSRSYASEWEGTDMDLGRLFTPDYVNHVKPSPPGGWKPGVMGAFQVIKIYRLSYPDLTIKIQEQLVAEDKVITRYVAEGTHTARPFLHLPPTAKHYKVTGIAIERIENGKMAESWGQWDMYSLLSQMGLIPSGLETLD